MICNFCGNPAAHPSTGCVYGPNTIACARCVRECWVWVRRHVNGRSKRFRSDHLDEFIPSASFYEAAGKFRK